MVVRTDASRATGAAFSWSFPTSTSREDSDKRHVDITTKKKSLSTYKEHSGDRLDVSAYSKQQAVGIKLTRRKGSLGRHLLEAGQLVYIDAWRILLTDEVWKLLT